MGSDRRLHPLSVVFALGGQARAFALPMLLLLLGLRSTQGEFHPWVLVFLIPPAILSLGHYLSFRYRYEPNELVIRHGLFFRTVRHVPYARIQNLEAVQTVVHRLLGVVDVRVETGGGQEPEATMSVLPVAAYEEMRRHVFQGRGVDGARSTDLVATEQAGAPAPRVLLQLRPADLVLLGLVQNRGIVIVGAVIGAVWELGVGDWVTAQLTGAARTPGAAFRQLLRAWVPEALLRVTEWAWVAVGLLVVLAVAVVLASLSAAWAFVRLHGFTLTRAGDDLRAVFGLFTRVSATIPVHRIQTLTIREGVVYRRLGRVSVSVQTAGSEGEQGARPHREWLAPVLRRSDLGAFLREVLPDAPELPAEWQGLHERAFRRAVKSYLLTGAIVLGAAVLFAGWRGALLLPPLIAWSIWGAHLEVVHTRWAVGDDAFAVRRGWLRRRLTVARVTKLQAIAVEESPFDRRAGMARLLVDTAGARQIIAVPYLPREIAVGVARSLAAAAARTAFRW